MTRLTLNLGAIGTVTAESEDARDLIRDLEFWRSLPTTCPTCGQPTQLRHQKITAKSGANAGKSFDYYRLRCINPQERHEVTLGQHADGSGLYYPESREWTAYRPQGDQEDPHQPAAPVASPHQAARAGGAGLQRPITLPDTSSMSAGEFRTFLAREFGLTSAVQQELASQALGRAVPDWSGLTSEEREVILDLALDSFVPNSATARP